MKTKNLIFLTFSIFLTFFSCNQLNSQIKIGKIQDGTPTLLIDEEGTKNIWEEFINGNSELNLTFEEISIQEDNSNYFLIAIDLNNKSVSKIGLELNNGHLYEARVNGGGYTITCSGCESTGPSSSNECVPEKEEGGIWYCSNCSAGTCKKTISTSSALIFSGDLHQLKK